MEVHWGDGCGYSIALASSSLSLYLSRSLSLSLAATKPAFSRAEKGARAHLTFETQLPPSWCYAPCISHRTMYLMSSFTTIHTSNAKRYTCVFTANSEADEQRLRRLNNVNSLFPLILFPRAIHIVFCFSFSAMNLTPFYRPFIRKLARIFYFASICQS